MQILWINAVFTTSALNKNNAYALDLNRTQGADNDSLFKLQFKEYSFH